MPKTRFELDDKDIRKALSFWFEHDFAEPKKLRDVTLHYQSGGGDPREPEHQFSATVEA